jgi:hypothetical protein
MRRAVTGRTRFALRRDGLKCAWQRLFRSWIAVLGLPESPSRDAITRQATPPRLRMPALQASAALRGALPGIQNP